MFNSFIEHYQNYPRWRRRLLIPCILPTLIIIGILLMALGCLVEFLVILSSNTVELYERLCFDWGTVGTLRAAMERDEDEAASSEDSEET